MLYTLKLTQQVEKDYVHQSVNYSLEYMQNDKVPKKGVDEDHHAHHHVDHKPYMQPLDVSSDMSKLLYFPTGKI